MTKTMGRRLNAFSVGALIASLLVSGNAAADPLCDLRDAFRTDSAPLTEAALTANGSLFRKQDCEILFLESFDAVHVGCERQVQPADVQAMFGSRDPHKGFKKLVDRLTRCNAELIMVHDSSFSSKAWFTLVGQSFTVAVHDSRKGKEKTVSYSMEKIDEY